jgi:hypothetical protein
VRALLLSREADAAAVAELDAAVADERGASVELLCCRRDCAPFWGHLSVTPVRRPGVPAPGPPRRASPSGITYGAPRREASAAPTRPAALPAPALCAASTCS